MRPASRLARRALWPLLGAAGALLVVVLPLAALGSLGSAAAVELNVASQPLLPVSSPLVLVGVDTGTDQAYVRIISVDVQQGVLQGVSARIYFPAAGVKAFLVEVYVYDSNGNQLDSASTLGVAFVNEYDATVALSGVVQVIDAFQVEVRVTCLLGC